jgi:hypothetical protein
MNCCRMGLMGQRVVIVMLLFVSVCRRHVMGDYSPRRADLSFRATLAEIHRIIPNPIPPVHGRCLSVSVDVISLLAISLLGFTCDSYCVESRFQLSMLRLLNEYVLVVDVLDDVYVAVLGVDLDDDGFDGGVTMYEHAF